MTKSETSLDYISPDLLDFDAKNPRFGGLMEDRGQEEIQKALLEAPYYATALVDSLLKNGFIDYEPLVVKRTGKRYIVVEGNRRLAAIREILAHPDKYVGKTEDLKHIPMLVFPDKPDEQQRSEMRVYLGVRHLLGIREWPAFSKALFLEHESKEPGGLDRVFKETQLKKVDAKRFLIPYRLLQDAGLDLPEGADFWMLAEAMTRTGIKKFLQLEIDSKTLEIRSYDKKNFNLLLQDIYGARTKEGGRDPSKRIVNETRDLSILGRVLGSEKAIAALRSGRTLEEAEIYVDTREESIDRLSKMTKSLGLLLPKLLKGNKNQDSERLAQAFKKFHTSVRDFVRKAN